ncbi:MAG: hypothetical protein ACPGVX_09775, partial [Thalassobaculaceae bacterium]
ASGGKIFGDGALLTMLGPMNLTIVTPNTDLVLDGRRSWTRASLRLRAGALAAPLAALGVRVKMIVSNSLDARRRDGSLFDGDVFWLSQSVEDWGAAFDALRAAGKPVVGAGARMAGLARRADAVTVSSRHLIARAAGQVDGPVHFLADAVEGERYPPGAAGADGPVRLIWFGWQQKIGALAAALDQLHALAERRPVALTCVTNPPATEPALMQVMAADDDRLSVTVLPWAAATYAAHIHAADFVLMPDAPVLRTSGKSDNRVHQAFWAGRLPIVTDRDSYHHHARFACLHDSLFDGVTWALGHRVAVLEAIAAAQDHIAGHAIPAALAYRAKRIFETVQHRATGQPS